MNDMSSVIVPKSDQINADDLIGGEMTITINEVKITGGQEQPVSIFFNGSEKAFRPCKTVSRLLVAMWGPDAKKYVGRSLRLYRDPNVKWGGLKVGGIRVRAASDIPEALTIALTETRGQKKPTTVQPLVATPATNPTRNFLAEIAGCPDRSTLRKWWSANNEAIPEGDYESVLGAFNARLNAVPKTAPAASAPQEDEGAAALASQPQEGRDDSQHGEYDAIRECCDRLVADARAGAGRSAGEQAEYEALPDDMRAEVDAAAKGGE